MRIGIIGTGRIRTALARQLTRVGHELVLANSRAARQQPGSPVYGADLTGDRAEAALG